MIRRLLALPEIADVDVDGVDRLELHAAVLERKPMLAAVFRECHELMLGLDRRTFGDTPGLRVELGAGVAPIAMTFPEVLATDVVPSPGLDAVIDAQCMDLRDGSVRALYCQPLSTTFPTRRGSSPRRARPRTGRWRGPDRALLRASRVGRVQAAVVSEDFDKAMPGWQTGATGPMHGANQALSYIVFKRDRARFEREFQSLELVETFPLSNYVRYLLSGGLNFRQLVPTFTEPGLRALELALRPARRLLGLRHVIVLRRRA